MPRSFTLGTIEIDVRHTSENLSNAMDNVLNEWHLNDNMVAIVTDNAANVVKPLNRWNKYGRNLN